MCVKSAIELQSTNSLAAVIQKNANWDKNSGVPSIKRCRLYLLLQRTAWDVCSFVRSFVRSFVIAGRGPAYSGPQRWDLYGGPMRQPRERSV